MRKEEKLVSANEMQAFLASQGYTVELAGAKDVCVQTFCSLNNPRSDAVTWIKNAQADSLQGFAGSRNIVVVAKECVPNECDGASFLITQEPKAVFFSLLRHFWGQAPQRGIAPTAVVESKNVGADVSIGHHCYIGPDVTIGHGTVIENNVTIINKAVIGSDCLIHSGVVIGTDGFGFFTGPEGWLCKVEHFGGVCIGDDVEIGANTCIDRGTIDDTMIGSHVKIDNLAHIGHNAQIADGATIIAGAILCGSTKVGTNGYVAPGGIIKNQHKIGDNAFVGLGAVVLEDVDPDTVVVGVPAKPLRKTRPEDR